MSNHALPGSKSRKEESRPGQKEPRGKTCLCHARSRTLETLGRASHLPTTVDATTRPRPPIARIASISHVFALHRQTLLIYGTPASSHATPAALEGEEAKPNNCFAPNQQQSRRRMSRRQAQSCNERGIGRRKMTRISLHIYPCSRGRSARGPPLAFLYLPLNHQTGLISNRRHLNQDSVTRLAWCFTPRSPPLPKRIKIR